MPPIDRHLLPLLTLACLSLVLPITLNGQEPLPRSMTTEEHFDELQAGDFETLDSKVGSWQEVEGRCLIDDQHA